MELGVRGGPGLGEPRYGGLQAVDGCTFGVQARGVVGLIGPTGAGKSTVISLWAGSDGPVR